MSRGLGDVYKRQVLYRLTSADHDNVKLAISSFSSGNSQIAFDPMRGTATSGEILLSSAEGRQLKVKVGLLGQIRICEPSASAKPVFFYNSTDC